ncbi:MAG: AAA family ATPase, partial [Mycoplasmataceae bacterium]|nr:AAA family ATPase [Mycoplasmataceae bacterium]
MTNQEEKILNYFKELASFEDEQSLKVSLSNEQKSKSWIKIYDKVQIKSDCVIKKFLNPDLNIEKRNNNSVKIFPFGANSSQITAINHALENQISITEGPPGTGKTQTILNIIANLLIRDKNMLIISNNNKAIENIKEKMEEYGLDFLIAFLGNKENKAKFLETQIKKYSKDILNWNFRMKKRNYLKDTLEELKEIFIKKEVLAKTIQELNELKLEFSYFNDIYPSTTTLDNKFNKLTSEKVISLMNIYEEILRKNKGKRISLFMKLKIYWKYRLKIYKFKDLNPLRLLFYKNKIKELEVIIKANQEWLSLHDEKTISNQFYSDSLQVLKKYIFLKYNTNDERKQFKEEDLWKRDRAEHFVKEYPIVLSTTHSAFDTLSS